MLIAILLGTYFYFTCCSDCRISDMGNTEKAEEAEVITSEPEPKPTSFPLQFKDNDFAFEIEDNFNFDLSSANFRTPLVDGIDSGINQLKGYLLDNSDKVINITGLYRGNETNSTIFPNLGLARAITIKNYFVSKGIPAVQTATFGRQMKDLLPLDGVLLGPVTYEIDAKPEDLNEKMQALFEKIKAEPLTVYFQTGEAVINLTAEQRQKVADISEYLDHVEDAQCMVIGHTDNVGRRASNMVLAKERADFVKSYLVTNGITDGLIKSSSKGPDAPIATNATDEGRALNRRVEVTLN